MNDHQQITAERGRRAADLRAAAVALLEQQAIASGVMLDLDSDQVVAAGPKAAILCLLSNGAPAATSGDAPADLQQLKALALAATPGPWFYQENSDAYTHIVRPTANPNRIIASGTQTSEAHGEPTGRYIAAANPAVVLGLIARIEHLTTVPEQAPSTEQEWAKVDPAVAFHLIERHAEDWADAGRMMEAWRAAVSAATKPTADLSFVPSEQFNSLVDAVGKASTAEGYLRAHKALVAHIESLLATKPAACTPSAKVIINDGHGTATVMLAPGAVLKVGESLYATPAASTTGAAQTAEQVRDQALEEAAMLFDENPHAEQFHCNIAEQIRELKGGK